MTDLSPIGKQIQEALAASLQREPSTIHPENHLRDDLGLDSLVLFEWLYELEKAFDLEIPNEDLPNLQTLGDVITYVEARVTSPTPSATATSVPPPAPARSAPTKAAPGAARSRTKSDPASTDSPSINNAPPVPPTPRARTTGKAEKPKAAAKGKGKKQ
ncbi:MAG: acyl carrier protein [Nitrospira sp.]|nr:acyl carrier protein [Nitrospira sp.]